MNTQSLLNIWRNVARAHYFDEQLYAAIESDRVKCFAYLSSGQESIAASVAEACSGIKPAIFCQHRNHAAYISFGGDVEKLRDELLGFSTGCTGGVGGDPMIHDPSIKFFGHSGLVADQVPIAVGYAIASGSPVVCFCGDGTVEEDVFMPAIAQAAYEGAPILFIIEDNDLSVITRKAKRRRWDAPSVIRSYGVETHSLRDSPQAIVDCVNGWPSVQHPLALQIYCERRYRHVGIGSDGPLKTDRFMKIRERASEIDVMATAVIEGNAIQEMADLWQEKQSR